MKVFPWSMKMYVPKYPILNPICTFLSMKYRGYFSLFACPSHESRKKYL